MINKETKIYGSFTQKAGNTGNIFFNRYFDEYRINAIYKSFSIDDIRKAVDAARCLNFGGFAVSMPFKKKVLQYLDTLSVEVQDIGACNTVINEDGKLVGYNTDYMGVKYLIRYYNDIIILGNGGLAMAARFAADTIGINHRTIKRNNWNKIQQLRNSVVLNCTPVTDIEIDSSNIYLDTSVISKTGLELYKVQAAEQFYLYTGIRVKDAI